MTTSELYKLHAVRPFKPFSIRLGDGQSLPIEHPQMLAYFEKARTATVYMKDGSFQIVDLLLITGLEVHPPRNGKYRRSSRRACVTCRRGDFMTTTNVPEDVQEKVMRVLRNTSAVQVVVKALEEYAWRHGKMRRALPIILLAIAVAAAMVGCASSPDPRLVEFQRREKAFGRADWIVLPTEQDGEEWVAPSAVEEEVRGLNRNDPPELRLDYSPSQRQVWLYPRERMQVRFEPNVEPRRTPMEPHFIQRHKEGERAKLDAQRAVQDLQRQRRERAR